MHGRRRIHGIAVAAALVLAVTAAGCTGSQSPSGQQGVSNQTNSFSYGGQFSGKTASESYTWENTQGRAGVSWGGQVASGSVTVTIRDAAGAQVYSNTFGGTGQGGSSDTTGPGSTGDWTISVQFSGFTGQMGLSVSAS